MFQKLSSKSICLIVIDVYDGEIGGDGGIPSGIQTKKSHYDLQVT